MQKSLKRLGLILIVLMLSLTITFGLVGCADKDGGKTDNTQTDDDQEEEKEKVAVTGVTLSEDEVELAVDETFTLSSTVQPSNASNKRVTWKSSDITVVTVANGLIKGVGEGTATITVTTNDGSKTDTCTVTVTAVHAEGVVINASAATLTEGDQLQITAAVYPANATDKTVEWTTTDDEIVTVSENGMVIAVGEGTATVRATVEDGTYFDVCTITVNARVNDFAGYTEIDSVEDWALIGQNLSGKYVLTADIDFENAQVDTIGNPYTGNGKQAFNGTIDGNGFAIMNAHFISGGRSDAGERNNSYSGMVAELGAAGIVRNISVINCSSSGEAYNALLVVWNHGLIENCYVQGSVTNDNTWWDGWTLGGVLVNINQGTIRNCVSWSQRDGITYGLVGSNYTTGGVYNCYVIRDETISDWAISGNVNGQGVTQQPLIDSGYVEIADAKTAASYPSLNSYWWVIEDGKVPYVRTSVEGGRDWQGPQLEEAIIIPIVSLNMTSGTFELSNGMVGLVATVELVPEGGAVLTWTSNNEDVATVDADGYVKFIAAGQVTITVSVEGGNSVSCTLTIVDNLANA